MLLSDRMTRLAAQERFSQLFDAVTGNGRPLPSVVRSRLCRPSGLPLTALGFALQRAVELSYSPTDDALALAGQLAFQLSRAMANVGLPLPVAALATAMGGLARFAEQCQLGFDQADPDDAHMAPVCSALQSAAAALARQQRSAAERNTTRFPARRGLVGDELDSAILIWQLAECPAIERFLGGHVDLPLLHHAAHTLALARQPSTSELLARIVIPGAALLQAAAPSRRPIAA